MPLSADELETALHFAGRFHERSVWSHLPLDREGLARLFNGLADSDDGYFEVSHAGGIGGAIAPFWFSPERTAVELFWYSHEPGEGKALRDRFEAWATAKGAAYSQFSAMAKPNARFTFRRATAEHARAVGANLRMADRAELAALGMADPGSRIESILTQRGDARAIVDEVSGRAVALFGVTEVAPGRASPWMLCAADAKRAARFMLRHGARWVRAWARRWPTLQNASDARNTMHHRFIEKCGFSWAGEASVGSHLFRVFRYV